MYCYALWTAITQRGCLFLQRDTHVSSKYGTQTYYGYGGIYGDVGYPILRVPVCLNGSAVVPDSIAAIPSLCNCRYGFVCCHSNATVRILLFSECPCSPSKRRELRLLMNCRLSADDSRLPVVGEIRPRLERLLISLC